MDVPLYAIALSVFAVLYLAIGVYLGITLIITLLIMLAYLAIRHGKLPENYPHGLGDSMITVTFIGVTWGIFAWLAPKNPIPFAGNGLTYQAPVSIALSSIIMISLVLAVIFLIVFSFIANDLRGAGPTGGGGGGDEGSKPKQGVGA
ncbi:MAG TPA: hypothetical protein VMH90_03755 [Thermoplasmata archaeon]|nr:hypothetical protein [Thermoplasmata archaeon]